MYIFLLFVWIQRFMSKEYVISNRVQLHFLFFFYRSDYPCKKKKNGSVLRLFVSSEASYLGSCSNYRSTFCCFQQFKQKPTAASFCLLSVRFDIFYWIISYGNRSSQHSTASRTEDSFFFIEEKGFNLLNWLFSFSRQKKYPLEKWPIIINSSSSSI